MLENGDVEQTILFGRQLPCTRSTASANAVPAGNCAIVALSLLRNEASMRIVFTTPIHDLTLLSLKGN